MDFKTPDRSRYYNPRPVHRVPAPSPLRPETAQTVEAPLIKKPSAPKPARRTAKWITLLIGLVLLGIIAWLGYGYQTTKHQLQALKQSPPSASTTPKSDDLVSAISQLADLPQGETPAIATISDASKLKSRTFFTSAQNGDKVLIYSKAVKAVLYRPSTGKIIEYSTVDLDAPATR